jgi:hypothetical protein
VLLRAPSEPASGPTFGQPVGLGLILVSYSRGDNVAQRKPEEHGTIEQVLKLVDGLSPEGREEVLYILKRDALRRDLQVGIDQANRGELFSEEDVLAQLKAHREKLLFQIAADGH